MAKQQSKKVASTRKANSTTTKAKDKHLRAYLRSPNYHKLAAKFGVTPMGLRYRVLRAAKAEGLTRQVARATKQARNS